MKEKLMIIITMIIIGAAGFVAGAAHSPKSPRSLTLEEKAYLGVLTGGIGWGKEWKPTPSPKRGDKFVEYVPVLQEVGGVIQVASGDPNVPGGVSCDTNTGVAELVTFQSSEFEDGAAFSRTCRVLEKHEGRGGDLSSAAILFRGGQTGGEFLLLVRKE